MKEIIVDISETGEVTVEAVGFKGRACELATKAIEDALGIRTSQTVKPEFHQVTVQEKQTLRIGGK